MRCYNDGEFDLDAFVKRKNVQLSAELEATMHTYGTNALMMFQIRIPHQKNVQSESFLHVEPKMVL
jgi:hypothetical protein